MDASALSIDWLPLLVIAGTTGVMFFLARRLMRGMNQQDWILLRQARMSGIDLTRAQNVAFVVFAATRETANELDALMRADGFDTSIKEAQIQYTRNKRKPGKAQEGWLITGIRATRLVPEELSKVRKALDEIALARKAAYLGWQISREGPRPQAGVAAATEPATAPAGQPADPAK